MSSIDILGEIYTIHKYQNAQNRTDNTQDNGDSQSQQSNHSQTTNTVPDRQTDTSMDGTGRIDTDTVEFLIQVPDFTSSVRNVWYSPPETRFF